MKVKKKARKVRYADAAELGDYIQEVMESTGLSQDYVFHESGLDRENESVTGKIMFAFCYLDNGQEVKTTYEVEMWGRENCA